MSGLFQKKIPGGRGEEGKQYIFLWVVGSDIFQFIWVIGVSKISLHGWRGFIGKSVSDL